MTYDRSVSREFIEGMREFGVDPTVIAASERVSGGRPDGNEVPAASGSDHDAHLAGRHQTTSPDPVDKRAP